MNRIMNKTLYILLLMLIAVIAYCAGMWNGWSVGVRDAQHLGTISSATKVGTNIGLVPSCGASQGTDETEFAWTPAGPLRVPCGS